MNYRFIPHKGLRRRGEPYEAFDTDIHELDEEQFMRLGMTKDEARKEYCEAVAALVYQVMNDDDEGDNDES